MKLSKAVAFTITACILTNIAACGTILYPERKGQTSGRIDVGVAVLDGLGLLLFIIPGVIAFAVDFTTGTIYAPHSRRGSLDGSTDLVAIKATQKIDVQYLEAVLHEQSGVKAHLSNDTVKIIEMSSLDEARFRLQQYSPLLVAQR
jgi:hypothetical protein